jgi:hypothetical protein
MRANTRKPIPGKLKDEPAKKRGRPAKPKVIEAEVVQLKRTSVSPPPSYNESVAADILDKLAEGQTLRAICREPGMPSPRTVKRWVFDDIHGFADRFERARELQCDAIFDEALEIADGQFADNAQVQAARLRVDTRKWFLATLNPKRYGEKVEITSKTERLTDDQIDQQLSNLLSASEPASLPPVARKLLGKPQRY